MKKVILGSLALAAMLAGPAMAADMNVKAPVYKALPPEPGYSWTGCYLGGNGLGGTDQVSISRVAPVANGSGGSNGWGFVGGGQVGCDYQAGPWVFGARGLFDWGQIKSNATAGTLSVDSYVNSFATATGRIGYIIEPGVMPVLFYVQGGGAWIQTNFAVTNPGLLETASPHFTGFDVGFGFERGFFVNWSLFGEFNYMGFGSKSFTFTPVPGAVAIPDTISAKQSVETLLFGLNYRFNFAGPVVARY